MLLEVIHAHHAVLAQGLLFFLSQSQVRQQVVSATMLGQLHGNVSFRNQKQ